MKKRFKTYFLSLFRELFLYHSGSLEFRAKVLAVVVAANATHGVCEQEILKDIAFTTYEKEPERAEILQTAVNEYLSKIDDNSATFFNSLIFAIEKESKVTKRFKNKIDIAQLSRFTACEMSSEDRVYQLRVLEFLKEVKA
ncbi:MAG: hypothetical protein ACQESH_06790 [Campylobacterota bacterium]